MYGLDSVGIRAIRRSGGAHKRSSGKASAYEKDGQGEDHRQPADRKAAPTGTAGAPCPSLCTPWSLSAT
ncbi:MAG: hypothetical protein M0Z91_12690, partial [Actinomycetota bacterium]|nr:hypothetical protein [Actinomycetota bacterium]